MALQFRREFLQIQTQPRRLNLACAEQFLHDPFGLVYRNGKADALRLLVDRRVDPYHVSVDVEERPAAVSGVDGGVRLDEMPIHAILGSNRAVQSTHHACRHGVGQPERVADRYDGLSDHEVFSVSQLCLREFLLSVDLDDRQIGTGIRPQTPAFVFLLI
jgi:hypothetical protein